MHSRLRFLSSSIGTKILIALTGLSLFGFLVAHLLGNLLAFRGPTAFNHYSHALISNPLILVAEGGLAALFALHVFKAVTNWASNRGARRVAYQRKTGAGHTSRKSISSTTMIVSGLVTFAFVVLHLRTFKFGPYYAAADEAGMRDIYRLLIEVFQSPVQVVFYVICMVVVLLHLRHGLSSALQSLGINHPRYNPVILTTGTILAVLIGVGFALIPVWAFFTGGRL